MNLSEIDRVVNLRVSDLNAIINILDIEIMAEKEFVLTLSDVHKAYRKTQMLLSQYHSNLESVIQTAYQDEYENDKNNVTLLKQIKNEYNTKINNTINNNIQLLLVLNEKNYKKALMRNVYKMSHNKITYSHSYIYDGLQRKILLADKFRKDIRKVLIDYVNDMKIFSAKNNGKIFAYTKNSDGSLHTRFLISDYINTDIKKKIFHPNVKSLAYIEE